MTGSQHTSPRAAHGGPGRRLLLRTGLVLQYRINGLAV